LQGLTLLVSEEAAGGPSTSWILSWWEYCRSVVLH